MTKVLLATTVLALSGFAAAAQTAPLEEWNGTYRHHHGHAAHYYEMTHRHHHSGGYYVVGGHHRSTASGGNPGGYADRN